MYGHEKSDPAIVAVKPTNNARQLAAELVEPRAGAEGSASQPPLHLSDHLIRYRFRFAVEISQ
jgi:hypothetical protein